MRLAFISSSFPPYTSGVGANAATITSGLAEKGYTVGAFIPEYPLSQIRSSPLVSPKVEIVRLPSYVNPLKKSHRVIGGFPNTIIKRLSDFKPDIIHLQEPIFHHFFAIKLWASRKHIPLVFAHHFPPEFVTNQIPVISSLPPAKSLINKIIMGSVVSLYNQSRMVITPTYAMKNLLINSGLKIPVTVISNGVDTKRFSPSVNKQMEASQTSRAAGSRQRPGSEHVAVEMPNPRNSQIILYLGRLDFDKNLDTLISAAKYIKGDYEIWFAGSGKAKDYLEKLTSRLNLNNQIKFLGYIPESEKPNIYRKATIFVMPSTAEAQSIVSLEAAASGLPLVLADAAALPELIDKTNPNGYLFRPRDPLDLADKISQLLSNPQKMKVLGQNSRSLAITHDIHKVIDTYEKIYFSLIS